MAAFLVEDISAFQWIYQKLPFILCGPLIPLDFYPSWLQAVAKSLPFSAMMYAPARLFVDPSAASFGYTLLLQIVWITVLAILLTLAYRRGVTYLTVNGG